MNVFGVAVNAIQVYISVDVYNHTWDDGYPSGGNYWSNYAGADLYSGPDQNITGSDGIIDTPYDVNVYSRDHYPLMKPYVLGDFDKDSDVDEDDLCYFCGGVHRLLQNPCERSALRF